MLRIKTSRSVAHRKFFSCGYFSEWEGTGMYSGLQTEPMVKSNITGNIM